MKKTAKHQRPLATAMATFPLVVAPTLQAQERDATVLPAPTQAVSRAAPPPALDICCLKFAERYTKVRSTYSIIGSDNEHTIYQNARNEYFYLDPATGDMTFLTPDSYIKRGKEAVRSASPAPRRMFKAVDSRYAGAVTIVGMDEAGHVVQENARGEVFYLDPSTGDMVFAKK